MSAWSGTIAPTGQAVTQAPHPTHVEASMWTISASAKPGSPGAGWMQLTGHATTHDASLQHDCVTTYGMGSESQAAADDGWLRNREGRPSILSSLQSRRETRFIIPAFSASIRTSANRSRSIRRDSGRRQ